MERTNFTIRALGLLMLMVFSISSVTLKAQSGTGATDDPFLFGATQLGSLEPTSGGFLAPALDPVAATATDGLGDFYTDDGGIAGNYNDNADPLLLSYCPSNPIMERIKINFTSFDVAEGDIFGVIEGCGDAAYVDNDPDNGLKELTYTGVGTGVTNSPNSGWVTAACDNYSGGFTIYWEPNGDGKKGAGWVYEVRNEMTEVNVEAPADAYASGDCGGATTYWVPQVALPACVDPSVYAVFASAEGATVAADGTKGLDLTSSPATITYEIYSTDDDGNADQATSKTATQTVTINVPTVTCNDNLNITLDPQACDVTITPDMVLEDMCPTIDYTVTIDGGAPVVHAKGVYEYEVENGDNNVICWGTITVEDKTAPECTGHDYDANGDDKIDYNPISLCGAGELFEDVAPVFTDCSMPLVVEHKDEKIGECTQLGDDLAAITAIQTALNEAYNLSVGETLDPFQTPTQVAADSDGNAIYGIQFVDPAGCNDAFMVEHVIARSWRATDACDNTSDYGCPLYEAVLRPTNIRYDDNVTIECGSDDTIPGPYYCFGDDAAGDAVHYPIGEHGNCFYAATYTDQPAIPTCGNTYKVIRNWTIVDWCDGDIEDQFTQIVKYEDTIAPEFGEATAEVVYTLGDFDCDAKATLPAIPVTDACNDVVVTVTLGAETVTGNGGSFTVGLGEHTATYTATDACGNSSTTTLTFEVEDNKPPVAVCESFRAVSLGSNCSARVYADAFDDGSFDSCSEITLEVRRMGEGYTDADFGSYVEYGIEDIDVCPKTGMMVILKVTDAAGNESRCMVEVELQDKVSPIAYSDEKTENCVSYGYIFEQYAAGDDISGELDALFGAPNAVDNCLAPVVEFGAIEVQENKCGTGIITRSFTAVDACGNRSNTATQTLYILDVNDWKITLPQDYEYTCVPGGTGYPEAATLAEILDYNNGCHQLGLEVEEEIFDADDACFKVVRTYKLIDWCIWDPTKDAKVVARPAGEISSTGRISVEEDSEVAAEGYFIYKQVIKVNDNEAPTVSFDHAVACDEDGDCAEEQAITVTVSDLCSATVSATYVLQDAAGTVASGDLEGGINTINTIALPLGTYQLHINATDGCGNYAPASHTFTITDCKAPAPICIAQVVVDLMPNDNGMMEIWATDFIASDVTDCSGPVKYSFSNTSFQPGLVASNLCTPDASDSEGLTLGANLINVYAWDGAGNIGECDEIVLIIQDNGGHCGAAGGSAIAGAIETEQRASVEDVEVNLSADSDQMMMTSSNGTYSFSGLTPGYDYTVTPEKDVNPLNGVSTFDLVLITKHILGVQSLDSPYKMIAADANNSKSITTFDMVELRKLILNIETDFANNTSWRFVAKDFDFANPSNPWATAFPEVKNFNNLSGDELAADFVAVKVGDVNGSAIPNSILGTTERNVAGTMALNVANATIEAGATQTIDFTAEMLDVAGYQFTLNFTDALEVVELVEGVATADNFGMHLLSEGVITASWNGEATNEVLFSLVVSANETVQLSEALSITSEYTTAEAYTTDAQLLDVAIAFEGEAVAAGYELYQNTPNPFAGETTISFVLPTSSEATVKVQDVTGKVLKVVSGEFAKGYNEVRVSASELQAGVLYYTLESADFTATKKMIIVE